MLGLVKRIETIAHSDAAVVITGESGTGKELVARALHEGERAPVEAVRRRQLRGVPRHPDRGGAVRLRARRLHGRRQPPRRPLQGGDGGTLFLDEVAELPQPAQAKLLRVLQEGTIEPLGSNETVKVDVRIISATHRDLRARIAEGLFREDLYYRINTLDIEIPPLRARGGDLPVLVQHFIKRFSNPARPTDGITWRAWNALSTYPFPGNVRELMHTIQHAVLLSTGGKIDFEHLPVAIRGELPPSSRPQAAPMAPLGTALKQFERAYLIRALAESDEKKGKAAESLGISRKNLWEKLKMHGIVRPPDADPGTRAAGDASSPFAA